MASISLGQHNKPATRKRGICWRGCVVDGHHKPRKPPKDAQKPGIFINDALRRRRSRLTPAKTVQMRGLEGTEDEAAETTRVSQPKVVIITPEAPEEGAMDAPLS